MLHLDHLKTQLQDLGLAHEDSMDTLRKCLISGSRPLATRPIDPSPRIEHPIATSSHVLQAGFFAAWTLNSLHKLPDDVLLEIIHFLDVEDILCLRRVSRRLFRITREFSVWYRAIQVHVIAMGLPVPGKRILAPLAALSALDLESRTVHALRLAKNWASSSPRPTRELHFEVPCRVSSDLHVPSVTQVLFMQVNQVHYLITVTKSPLENRVTCWELPPSGADAFMVASTEGFSIDSVVVNSSPTPNGHFGIISTRSPQDFDVQMWNLDAFYGQLTKIGLPCTDTPRPLLIHGEHIVYEELISISLFNYNTGALIHLTKPNDVQGAEMMTLAVEYVDDTTLIVVFDDEMALYNLTSVSQESTINVLDPVSTCEMNGSGTVTAAFFCRCGSRSDSPDRPLTILFRDGETLEGWYLDLFPKRDPPLMKAGPYCWPPRHCYSSSLPPSCSNIFLGQSGRGFWVENRNVSVGRNTKPARCVIPLTLDPYSARWPDPELQDALVLTVSENPAWLRTCGIEEMAQRKYACQSFAFEDVTGRLAIGSVEGTVTVLDFA